MLFTAQHLCPACFYCSMRINNKKNIINNMRDYFVKEEE